MGRVKIAACVVTALVLAGCTGGNKRIPVAQPEVAALPPEPQTPSLKAIPSQAVPPKPTDAVGQLISQAENLYTAGMASYSAGNYDEAKEKFDQAVSVLLQSNLDIQENDRLDSEFNKLVEDISNVEVAASGSGGALSGQQYEPAPIESFAGLTFPVDPKVKERAQAQIHSVHSDLPLVSNDLVDGVITYFQGRGQGFIETVLRRIGKYQPMISTILQKEGLPQDLIYLAASESAFNPFAFSRMRCVGIWQFSLGTGRLYGLKRNAWVDEREDPVKATEAAARHLKDLYQTFGDWYLAMAAYDSGPLTVQRAIEKTGYADFWDLRRLHALPTETENYVPIILATALIGKNPKAFGFDVAPDPPLAVDQVKVSVPTNLHLVAELINHPAEELIQLNPSLRRWTTPANEPDFVLNLPAGTGDTFERAIAAIPPGKRAWWRVHNVADGDKISTIAAKYRISPYALAEANGMSRNSQLEPGTRLLLPLAPGRESSLERGIQQGAEHLFHYRVKAGDTLDLIADRFDVTPYQIRRWNHLRSSRIAAGSVLRLYRRARSASSRPAARRASKTTHPAVVRKKTRGSKKSEGIAAAKLAPASKPASQ